MVRLSLEHKADINAADKSGYTPLLNAAERGNMAIVEILTERGADLAARTLEGATAFGLAAGSTNRLLLEWLSAKQPALDAKDQAPALQHAALYGRLANVQWLLDKGVPVSVTINSGTPLHAAAGGPGLVAEWRQERRLGVPSRPPPRPNDVGDDAGSEDDYARIVSLLLKSGAEVNAADSNGRTPLHIAVNCGCLPTADILLQHQADAQARNMYGKTPLHDAAALSDDRMVELLLANGARIEAKDNDQCTPLHNAAAWGNLVTVKALLAHGADVSTRDRYRTTPLHWAVMTTNVLLVTLLLDAGAAINALDMAGRTPLHQAADTGREAVVKLLLEHKAATTALDVNSDTPQRI